MEPTFYNDGTDNVYEQEFYRKLFGKEEPVKPLRR